MDGWTVGILIFLISWAVINKCIATFGLRAHQVAGAWVVIAGIYMGIMDAEAAHYVAVNHVFFSDTVSNMLVAFGGLSVIGTAIIMAALIRDITGEW